METIALTFFFYCTAVTSKNALLAGGNKLLLLSYFSSLKMQVFIFFVSRGGPGHREDSESHSRQHEAMVVEKNSVVTCALAGANAKKSSSGSQPHAFMGP